MATLLQEFVREKLGGYIEPQRAGTPRGEKIGYTKVKYHAALLALTNAKQKDIAADLKVNYCVVRKWLWEQDFKQLVGKLHTEFADSFMSRVDWLAFGRECAEHTWESEYVFKLKATTITYDEFRDVGNYSRGLRRMIRERLDASLRNAIGKRDFYSVWALLDIAYVVTYHFLVADGCPPDEAQRYVRAEFVDSFADLKDKASAVLAEEVRAVLTKPDFSGSDRRHALYLVGVLGKRFTAAIPA
ncbi:hypothetical protein BROC_01162 [Candidatus Brocadiaceae bacterium]|nr:hypothetical protein BROC_01162 [Candidatus Brocadiaceae bacterium]